MKTIIAQDNEYTFQSLTFTELSVIASLFYGTEKWLKAQGKLDDSEDARYSVTIPAEHTDGIFRIGAAEIRIEYAYGQRVLRITDLIAERDQYRANKQWTEADKIRDYLLGKGIELHDDKSGTWWTRS